MVCHFRTTAGAEVPFHSHEAAQTGYVISGKVEFEVGEDGESFVATAGTGYSFQSWESHRARFLEDSELIEIFAPARPEFMDE
jgi:quercetin dioxygenase-like cupin family protein